MDSTAPGEVPITDNSLWELQKGMSRHRPCVLCGSIVDIAANSFPACSLRHREEWFREHDGQEPVRV